MEQEEEGMVYGVLGLYEDVSVGRVQHRVTDELLGHRDGLVHGDTQV